MHPNNWTVITGSSSGIGLACAKKFIEEGHQVIGTYRDEQVAKENQKMLGPNYHPVHLEITDQASIAQASNQIKQILTDNDANLSCLINNSGVAIGGPLKYLDIETLRYQFEVNVFGLFAFTQKMIPLLEEGPKGRKRRIFNMSSISGRISTPFLGPYTGSKFALEALTDALRLELYIHKIGVILIEPGPIKTPIWDKSIRQQDKYLDTEYAPFADEADKMIKLLKKKAIPPEKVANVVFKAWESKSPKRRYLIGRHRLLLSLFIRFAPDSLKDWLNLRRIRKFPDYPRTP